MTRPTRRPPTSRPTGGRSSGAWRAASPGRCSGASLGRTSTSELPIVPVVSIGGPERALFLSRGERLARLLMVDRWARLKVLPLSIALPWGVNVGDMLGHIPRPAKITIETLPAIDIRKKFGAEP